MKNINIEELINKTKKYKIEKIDKDIPYLMIKFPYLLDFSVELLENELSDIKLETPLDNIYMILATLAKESISYSTESENSSYYNQIHFFSKLEDLIVLNLGFNEVRYLLVSKRYNKARKIELVNKKYKGLTHFYTLLKKFDKNINLFTLNRIQYQDKCIFNLREANELATFCNRLNTNIVY